MATRNATDITPAEVPAEKKTPAKAKPKTPAKKTQPKPPKDDRVKETAVVAVPLKSDRDKKIVAAVKKEPGITGSAIGKRFAFANAQKVLTRLAAQGHVTREDGGWHPAE